MWQKVVWSVPKMLTEIKVYSNEQSVTLFVDGVERETSEGSKSI